MKNPSGTLALLDRIKQRSGFSHVPVIWDVGRKVTNAEVQALFEVHRFGTAVKITISPEVFAEDRETIEILHSALKAAGDIYSGSTTATRVWAGGTDEEALSDITPEEKKTYRKRTVREQLADAQERIRELETELQDG